MIPLHEVGWLSAEGPQGPIVLSTRLRLARNLARYSFPAHGTAEGLLKVVEDVGGAVARQDLQYLLMHQLPAIDHHLLVERHLISPAFCTSVLPRGLGLKKDGTVSLMVNEEDHIRLQVLLSGLQFERAWQIASQLDDVLSQSLEIAYDSQFGFLTACPSNVGTGLRASVMLHLPGLAWLKALDSIANQVAQMGLTVRGLYGEGTRSAGNLLQISNQVTLGPAEEDILAKLNGVAMQLIHYENSARAELQRGFGPNLQDRVWRCLGVLCHARLMESAEAMEHLSLIKLGTELELLPEIPGPVLNRLMIRIRPANLQKEAGRELDPMERDVARARLLRDTLSPYLRAVG